VGFSSGNGLPKWQTAICKPEWSHVYCFAQAGPAIQVVNPCVDRLEIGIEVTGKPAVEYARHLHDTKHHTILRINHVPERIKWRSVLTPTCVSVVKVVLGYNTGWLDVTPERLFFHMLDKGGAELLFV
jgi:hypothetical protein